MATKASKKDLEDKIAELEAKLTKLSAQLESKPAPQPQTPPKPQTQAPPPPQTPPKPQTQAPPPKPQPAATSPRGSLPAGMKPAAQTPPQKTETAGVPSTINQALENAYNNSPMTSFHEYRTKVTGYSPAPNRYFLRQYAIVGKVPTRPWNEQKVKVTGYTQPSNQYFATRKRLAYHPADRMFGSFGMTVEGVTAQTQTQAPPPPPKPQRGTLPAGFKPTQQPQAAQTQTSSKSRKEMLEEYEKDYLARLGYEREEAERIAAEQAAQQAKITSPRGSLPKGF